MKKTTNFLFSLSIFIAFAFCSGGAFSQSLSFNRSDFKINRNNQAIQQPGFTIVDTVISGDTTRYYRLTDNQIKEQMSSVFHNIPIDIKNCEFVLNFKLRFHYGPYGDLTDPTNPNTN